MSFAEAAFLAGLAAVAVPIALHLLYRGRSRRIPFPSVRFLRDVEVRSARRKRIEEWAVLILRAGAIAALALALARPVLRGGAAGLGERSRALVIDNSMSMDARGPGGTALERSLAFARELLRRSGAADRVAIVPVWGDASPLSEDKSRAEAALAAIRPTWRDSPLVAAVRRALALLAEDRSPAKDLYVLSDFQASAFEGAEPLGDAPLAEPPAGVATILLRPAVRSAANAALISAEPEPGGLLRVRLRAHGGEAVARLELSVGGRPHAERSVRAESGREASATFRLPELPPGLHRARVRSGDDVLPADNVLEAAIEVLPERPVIVARGADRAPSPRDPASYVEAALASAARWRRATRFELRAIEELSGADLSRSGAVILIEPSAIPDALGAALADFVRRGG
ncbi:MAG: BatA domain-containing protein, partial [Planctomycetota bacterium]